MATQKEATLLLYRALNHPVQAGKVWVKYERKTIDAVIDVLKQMLAAQGYEFRPESLLPAERECCGTFPRTPHRATCAKYRWKFKVTSNAKLTGG